MTDDLFDIGIGPARDRLEGLSRRAEALPADAHDLVDEILEAFAISVEELQVAAEELHQQKEELLAAREEVESQRSRYRDLFEFAPNGYMVTDPTGVIEDANQAAVKLLRVPKSELVDKPLVVYVRPGEWDRYHVFLDRVTGVQPDGEGEVELAIGLQPRRGPAFPAALTVASVRDAGGELTGLRWLLRDMTASKQAEERERLLGEIQELMVGLEQERQTLQTIMENTPAQLALLDPEFNFVRVNAAYAEGAGHSREELIGRNHFEVFPDPENQAIFEGVRDIGQPVAYEARPFEYADQPERGVTYWDWTLVPVKDEAGVSRGLVISLAEVTERVRARQERERLLAEAQEQRRQAQQASRETEAANRLLQALIETMPIGVVVADKASTLGTTNAAAQAILGSPVPSDVSHAERTYAPHYPDGSPFPAQDMPLMRALAEGKEVRDVEILIRRSDGSERTLLASGAPVKDESGATVSAITVFQDITARKQAEEALRGAKGELEIRVRERTAELEQEIQERIRTEQSLRLEEARLDALLQLSQISGASLEEIASFTLEQGVALTNSRIGFVGFLNEDESVYTLHAVSKDVVKECDVAGDPIQWHVVDAGIWADAIRERRTLFVNDYSQPHPRKKGLPAGHPYVERFMVVPVLEGERIVAIAGVGNKASDYDDSDERQIILLLSGMWGYVQRNRSREELEQAYDELEERVRQRTAELSLSNAALKEEITERKRAEEALQEERDRLAALINSIRDEIWFADAAGRFTLVNPSGSSTFALEAETIADIRQLAGSLQVLRPDGTPRPIEEAPPLRALRGEVVTNQEELLRTPATGEFRHRQVSAAPVRDGSGNIIGSVSVVHDITALKQAEEERERLLAENRRQRAFLERLIEAAPVGLAVVRGPDHRYELVNPRYRAIPGMPDAPMVGHTIAEVFPDVVGQDALEMVEQVYQTGQTVGAREYEASAGPGREETYWDVDHVPLRGPDGAVDGVLILTDEVTDEVLARRHVQDLAESLARERDVLQTIMENTRTQLAYLDPQFRFGLVNSAYVQGSGHSSEELMGHHYFDLFPDPENQAIFQRVRDTAEPVEFLAKPFEFAGQPERGVTYWDWTLVPVKNPEGQVQGLVLSLTDVTDMQRLLMALGAERARLKAIIENAPEAIVVADQACRLVLANPAADRLYAQPVPYGQDLESQAGLALRSADGALYDPHDLPLTRSVRDGETVRNLEMTVRQPDGQLHHLLVSTAPIQDEQGDVAGAVGVFQDITERRRTRQALQRYATRLRILHETDQAILAARSAEEIAEAALSHVQQLVSFLRASVVLFNLEKNEASVLAVRTKGETRKAKGWRGRIGNEWNIETLAQGQIHVVEDLQALPSSSPLLEILQGEGLHSYVHVPLLARDTLLGSLNLGMASPGAPGPEELDIAREMAAQLAIGLQQARLHEQLERHAVDLEQRVARRTAALQASQARLQAIFDGAAIGIALADAGGRILESNPTLQAMLGYSADELRTMLFTGFTHPGDVKADVDLFRELVVGSRTEYSLDKRYIRKDGKIVWARLTVSLVRVRKDQAPLAIGMVEDITEQKEIQDALLRTEKLAIAGQLGASLAHEINNPLQAVIGCLGLAEKNLAEGEGVRRYLRVAREELRRAADIVAQLRDLHRLSEPEEKKATDLSQLLDEVLLLCRKKCDECKIELGWDATADLPSVLLVPGQMRQVFLNLILNAVDATPEGGRLKVSTARIASGSTVPAGVCISFADSGSGITSDVLPHVFDPFYSTKPQGLGLGLYITHKIVEAHGGRIDVSSRPGEGTVFSVWLPA
jgi:PAS domain S-box-containing protein